MSFVAQIVLALALWLFQVSLCLFSADGISIDSPMSVHPQEIALNADVFFHFQPICLSFGGVT